MENFALNYEYENFGPLLQDKGLVEERVWDFELGELTKEEALIDKNVPAPAPEAKPNIKLRNYAKVIANNIARRLPIDDQIIIDMYLQEKMSSREIAKKLNTDKTTILTRLRKYNIKFRTTSDYSESKSTLHLLDKEQAKKLYYEDDLSFVKIAEMYQCFDTKVGSLFKEWELPTKQTIRKEEVDKLTKEDFENFFYDKKMGYREIARHFKVHFFTVKARTDALGINPNKSIKKIDKQMLEQLYFKERKSLTEIAEILSMCTLTVAKRFHEFGLVVRPPTETKKILIPKEEIENFISQGMCAKDISKKLDICSSSVANRIKEFDIDRTVLNQNSLKRQAGCAIGDAWVRKTKLKDALRMTKKYQNWRKECLKRDNYTCQLCQKYSGELQVDHIVPYSYIIENNKIDCVETAFECEELWDLNNGRTLCVACHKQTDTFMGKARKYKGKINN